MSSVAAFALDFVNLITKLDDNADGKLFSHILYGKHNSKHIYYGAITSKPFTRNQVYLSRTNQH